MEVQTGTKGKFTVPPGGDGFYLLLCLLFTNTTAQPEHSQCPLMETDSITSLFIIYRYDSTTGTFTAPPSGDGFYYFSFLLFTDMTARPERLQCPLVEMDSITSLFILQHQVVKLVSLV